MDFRGFAVPQLKVVVLTGGIAVYRAFIGSELILNLSVISFE